jgi:hypothetical protein
MSATLDSKTVVTIHGFGATADAARLETAWNQLTWSLRPATATDG